MSHLSKCKNKFLYICLDASDGDIENEILAENEFCKVRMLGAKSGKELDENDLKDADVVAVWHTITLDSLLLNKLTKPPKVIHIFYCNYTKFYKQKFKSYLFYYTKHWFIFLGNNSNGSRIR